MSGCVTVNPWEIPRPEYQVKVDFYGRSNPSAQFGARWVGAESVLALALRYPDPRVQERCCQYAAPVSARANAEFDFDYFNHGDYGTPCRRRYLSESISKVLYPMTM